MSEETANTLFALYPLVAARLLPIVMFTPLFGGEVASRRFRTGIVMVLAAVYSLGLLPSVTSLPSGIEYGLLALKEALLGGTWTVLLILAFQLAAAIGALIDVSRGSSFAMLLDPSTRQNLPVSGLLLFVLVVTLFVTGGGYVLVLNALADSFVMAPPQTFALGGARGGTIVAHFVELTEMFFALTLRLAMPVIVLIFLIDIGLGLINRVAPQIQVFFLGLTIKGWVGVAVLSASLAITVTESLAWIGRLVNAGLAWLGGG